jgi:hypothetical protein
VQLNTVWSWCAVNEHERKVYFSVWTNLVYKHDGKTSYIVQAPDWGIDESGRKSPARNDHDNKLSLVFDQGYESYGYFIEARDRTASPREIENTRTSFVMRLELAKLQDGSVIGTPLERIEISWGYV